jgi:tetratricopeptide (TPR) repeat protein
LGQVHSYSGEFLKAQSSLAKVAPIFEKANWQPETQHDLKNRIEYLNWQAYLEGILGHVAQTEDLLQWAISLNDGIDLQQKSLSYRLLGNLKANQGQIEEALALFQQSLDIKERIGDVRNKAATQCEIAGIKPLQGKIGEAEKLYQEALHTFRKLSYAWGTAETLWKYAEFIANYKNEWH